jgi:hypothetical protein
VERLPKIVIIVKDNRRNGNFEGKGITVIALTFNHLRNEKRDIVVVVIVFGAVKSKLKDT